MKETYKNWGIPLTVITKETVQAKNRDNEIKKKRGPANPQQGNDCLFKIKCQHPNHHGNIRTKTRTRSNARSTEFRFEEHHEERVGTNII